MMPHLEPRHDERPVFEDDTELRERERSLLQEITRGIEMAEQAIAAWTEVLLFLRGDERGDSSEAADEPGDTVIDLAMPSVEGGSQLVTYDRDVALGVVLHEINGLIEMMAGLKAQLTALQPPFGDELVA